MRGLPFSILFVYYQSEGGEAAAARPIKIPGRVGLGGLLLSPFPFPSFPFPAGGSPAAGCENKLLLSI